MNRLQLLAARSKANAVFNHTSMNMNMPRTSATGHFHASRNTYMNTNAFRTRIQPMLTSALPEPENEHDHEEEQNKGKEYNNTVKVNETASWQPYKNIDIQRVTQTAIIHEITHQQSQTIAKVVPWFLANMPNSYFNTVPEEFRLDHMKAVSAIQDANMDLHLNLKTHLPDGRLILTYIRPGKADQTAARKGATGRILNLVKDLPWNHNASDYLPLSRVQVFNSEDDSMSISIFVFGEEGGSANASEGVVSSSNSSSPLLSSPSSSSSLETIGSSILDYAHHLQSGDFAKNVDDNGDDGDNHADDRTPLPNHIFEKEELLTYFEKCPETYIVRSDPRRFLKQRELYEEVTGTECMAVSVEKSWAEHSAGDFWVDIAVANSLPQVALENASMVLSRNNFDIVRAHLDILSDGDNGDVCMLRLLVERHEHHDNDDPNNNKCDSINDSDIVNQVEDISVLDPILLELKRTKWMDPHTMELVFQRYPWLSLRRGEVITGLCSLLHPIMSKKNAFAFSLGNIFDMMTNKRYIQHASSIADLFLDRFRPSNPLSDEDFDERKGDLMTKIMADVEDTMAKDLLIKMIEIVSHTLRTNIYLENRYALGLRLDPNVMHSDDDADDKEVPYGVIFVHGRRFNSFHVRFKDIARGGMRLVTPTNQESHALESARQYDECYGLAYAQQLKNKDIPEGGSKAVNLINCDELSGDAKQFVMRKSVKAFTNTIFDLIVETDETRQRVVDRLGKSEVLYLGPDEQVTVEDINWIVKRAKNRGYAIPNAFMSSKPASGINHKEFGVTSEGVNTYLDVALRNVLDIDPTKDKFTVKITGGPDGDVAGNEIKILFREYGDNVKIVGIADGSGCAEDPDGLDHDELLRLVDNTLSISQFNWSKLGSKGELHTVDNEEGIKARNSMHNRLVADAFIPAGGRPNTIDMSNYKNFLLPDGSPSSRLIVEGANLFITGDARQALYDEAGVAIIKDSSANKAGVITSSYEICSAMLLSEEDFASNKPQIVSEVLEKLRGLARAEAELLFSEYESHPDALPMISERISNTINTATDAISKELDGITADEVDDLLPLFRDHLPDTISDLAFHEVHSKVPRQYIRNAIASCLASKLVYKEGCAYIQSLNQGNLASLAIEYISKEREVEVLKKALEGCNDMADAERLAITQILEAGGTRTALSLNK